MNKRQLVVIWIAAIYFAVLGSSFLLRAYYLKYPNHGYVTAMAEMGERGLKRLSASKDHATSGPAQAMFEKATEQVDRKTVEEFEHSLWSKMSSTILRSPDVLILGLPFMVCLGAIALYSLKSHRKSS